MHKTSWRKIQFLLLFSLGVMIAPTSGMMTPVIYANPAPGAKSLYKKAMKESDLQTRVQILQQAIREKPDYVDALRELGLAFAQLENYAESEKYLLLAYKTNASEQKQSEKIFLLYELSRTYEKQGLLKNAEESLRGAIGLALKPNNVWRLNIALAKNLAAQERFSEALLAANKANDATAAKRLDTANLVGQIEEKAELNEKYLQAKTAQADGDYIKAKTIYTMILQSVGTGYKDVAAQMVKVNEKLSNARNFQILENVYQKALAFDKRGKIENAMKFYQNIILEGGYKDSQQRFDRLVKRKAETERETRLERAYQQGLEAEKELNWITASMAYEEIIAINPKYKDTQKRLREANRRANQNQSETLLARFYGEGLAAKNRDDYTRAHTIFLKICRINPNYEDAKSLLAEIEGKISASKLANPEEGHPSNPVLESLYTNAENEIKIKNWRRAIVILEKIQIIDKGYHGSDTLLTYCKKNLFGLDSNEPKNENDTSTRVALAFVISCIVLVPFFGYVVISPAVKVRIYLARKNYAAAARIYERILQKHPNRIRVLPMLAHIYLLAGRQDEQAIKIYKMIMQLNLSPEHQPQISSILTQNYLTESQTADADGIHLLEEALASEYKKKNEENS